MGWSMEFTEFFRRATGRHDSQPYDYQRRVAEDGLPDVLEVPTGAGKTFAAVGGWLYRRFFHPDPTVQSSTPRRLVYALPMRVLVESVADEAEEMLRRLGLDGEVSVLRLMGGLLRSHSDGDWRQNVERPTIVVGTIDQVVSRQLVRGYGSSRRAYPVDFALVTNGAHVVVDEMQLAGQATSTTRQIAAFQRGLGTAEPTGLTVMSATIEPEYLDTVDNPYPESTTVVRLSEDDARGSLRRRLEGTRRVHRLGSEGSRLSDSTIAEAVIGAHRPQTLTLLVVNRVDEAQDLYAAVKKRLPADLTGRCLLVHSRYRAREREALNVRLRELTGSGVRDALAGTPGMIIVATQSVEAGIDLDAAALFTEAAPWPSICQRAGRCNRAGEFGAGEATTATLSWFTRGKAAPYEQSDVDAAIAQLESWEGVPVTSRRLAEAGVRQEPDALTVLRLPTLVELFDTSPDLTGGDIDVSRYIRSDDDTDVQVAWIERDSLSGDPAVARPDPRWQVSVPLGALRAFLKQSHHPAAWVFDTFGERWIRVAAGTTLRPQSLVLIDRDGGGYDETLGFAPGERTRVVTIDTDEMEAVSSAAGDAVNDANTDDVGGDAGSFTGTWQLLDEHLADARAEAESLLTHHTEFGSSRDGDGVAAAVVAAAYLHDLGKAFGGWQDALRQIGIDQDNERVFGSPPPDGVLLAKGIREKRRGPQAAGGTDAESAPRGRRRLIVRADPVDAKGEDLDPNARFRALPQRRRVFRHELVSVLYLRSSAGRDLLRRLDVPEARFSLVDYLVGAHHGVLRVAPRDPVSEGRDGRTLLGVVDGEQLPPIGMKGIDLPSMTADLSLFSGGGASWGESVAGLLEEFGPFRLAYLETLVRMVDWRVSAEQSQGRH